MARHNYKSSATVGDGFQTKIENMLDSAKIPHRAEKTLSSSKIRKLDKKADYEVYPNDNPIYLEVKTSEHNKTVGYCLYQSSKKVWLKFHQICKTVSHHHPDQQKGSIIIAQPTNKRGQHKHAQTR